MPHEIRVQERFEIVTADGARLAATLHEPVGAPKAALQIQAGMGIKRQVYRHFAAYLATQGYAVLSFDVRDMGESRHKPLRQSKATMLDWGRKDLPAGLDWLVQRYPDVPRFAIGHSLGGQLTALMPNYALFDGMVLIFVPVGNAHQSTLLIKLAGLLFMGMYMPLTIALFGYARVSSVMTAQDVPAGAAWDWIRTIYHRRWFRGAFDERGEKTYFENIDVPTLALSLDPDFLAPPAACAKLLHEYYSHAKSEMITLRAADVAEPSQLSHLGYFRKRFADSHWSQVAAWLDRQVDDLKVAEPQAMTA